MLPNLILIIIYILNIQTIFSQIVIPFETFKQNITPSDYPSTFMYSSFTNKIQTKIKIGTPYQEIFLRIKTLRIPTSINSIKMGTHNIIRFNQTNSSSYIPLHEKPYYYGELDFTNAIKSKEIIYFNNNLILKNFSFLLGIEDFNNHRESGVLGLGLQLPDSDHRVKDVSFIKQIKEKNLIKNYTFFIEYDKDNLNETSIGKIILGKFPHEYNKDKYNKKFFREFYAEIVLDSLGFKIKEAFYGKNKTFINMDFKALLAVEDNFIRGTKIFKTILLEKFFDKNIERRLCYESRFTYLDNNKYDFFYCEKKINLSYFENMEFIVDNFGISEEGDESYNNTNLVIELNYEDLFTEFDNKYYFMMYFPVKNYETDFFKFGKVLFQKYLLNFNLETKKIGFYLNEKKEEKKENIDDNGNEINKEKESNFIAWILVGILVLIVLGLIGFIFYINPCKKRTKRANELIDDNYTYDEGINQN